MINTFSLFLVVTNILLAGTPQNLPENFSWPGGEKLAISLSYDDALNSQLDYAIPTLDNYKVKASFYLLPSSPTMDKRMNEWRSVALSGHELGNHSMYHPCRASLPNREWVPAHRDLDKYSVEQMVEEVSTANTFLKAIDGKTERTFIPPCGDVLAGGKEYLSKVSELFLAIKGQGIETGFSAFWGPSDVTGKELINYLKNIPSDVKLVNIGFHGVGGDYLSVSSEAHTELIGYLAENSHIYYVDTYINIMKHVNDFK